MRNFAISNTRNQKSLILNTKQVAQLGEHAQNSSFLPGSCLLSSMASMHTAVFVVLFFVIQRRLVVFHEVVAFTSSGVPSSPKTTVSSLQVATSSTAAAALPKNAIPKYLRWNIDNNTNSNNEDNDSFTAVPSNLELQTAITTFQRRVPFLLENDNVATSTYATQRVQLHAQIHLAETSYFEYYNRPPFTTETAATLYELLLDDSLIEWVDDDSDDDRQQPWRRRRRVKKDAQLQSSQYDQNMARQYNWSCQVDTILYNQSEWYHADLTRQEYNQRSSATSSSDRMNGTTQQQSASLWPFLLTKVPHQLVVQLRPSGATLEAATALFVGPPTVVQQPPQQQQRQGQTFLNIRRRRLFTNLFLPGDSFAIWLRYVLWIAVPSPEISILLLDWSSSWSLSSSSFGSKSTTRNEMSPSRFSRIALPILQALLSGRIQVVRQMVFGQVILAGHETAVVAATNDDITAASESSLLIAQRNDHALDILFSELQTQNNKDGTTTTTTVHDDKAVALLYGCNHCPDLHRKLLIAGFEAVNTDWRTAWTVRLADENNHHSIDDPSGTTRSRNDLGFFFSVLLPLFLLVSGSDWIATLQSIGVAAEESNWSAVAATMIGYLIRHVVLYIGLSKLFLDGELYNTSENT